MMRERGREGREAASGSPAENHAFELLVLAGLERRTAHALVKKAAFELGARAADPEALLDQLAEELMQTTETLSWLSRPSGVGPRVLALIGPTGVGKTTTLAKIASEAILKKGFKVGLINLDSYKVAAFDQLATYAKILKAPFRSASSLEDLRAAVQDFQSMDLILIDTTGRSQRDPQALKEMQDILDGVGNLECALVLSATTRDGELYDCASRFSSFHPRGLIFSKLDEATTYGCISNTSSKAKLPLLYFTTGQRVPEDIEEATPERLTALILDL
jgi:flagellar biosynthesis protein FlhF